MCMQRRSLHWMLQQESCNSVPPPTRAIVSKDRAEWHGLHLKFEGVRTQTGAAQALYVHRLTGHVQLDAPPPYERPPGGTTPSSVTVTWTVAVILLLATSADVPLRKLRTITSPSPLMRWYFTNADTRYSLHAQLDPNMAWHACRVLVRGDGWVPAQLSPHFAAAVVAGHELVRQPCRHLPALRCSELSELSAAPLTTAGYKDTSCLPTGRLARLPLCNAAKRAAAAGLGKSVEVISCLLAHRCPDSTRPRPLQQRIKELPPADPDLQLIDHSDARDRATVTCEGCGMQMFGDAIGLAQHAAVPKPLLCAHAATTCARRRCPACPRRR
jgi:hypothetical protein